MSAASSLQDAFTRYAASFPNADIHQSFAGSDQLAAQIRSGARPDVFASASTNYPQQLHRAGLVQKPQVFAANRLVIAVPKNSDISSLADLAKPGTTLVIGDNSVPVGAYTREVLVPYLDAEDMRTCVECLFGDAAGRTLGFTPRGLSPWAGLALALHDARTSSPLRGPA